MEPRDPVTAAGCEITGVPGDGKQSFISFLHNFFNIVAYPVLLVDHILDVQYIAIHSVAYISNGLKISIINHGLL